METENIGTEKSIDNKEKNDIQKRHVGACWVKQNEKTGEKYLGAKICFAGQEYRIVILKNNFKTVKDNLPDYEIFLTEKCYNEINEKTQIDL